VTLHLVCDISGGMSDGGKPFIMRTLVTTVAQWAWYGYGRAEITLWAWAAEARRVPDWGTKSEFPAELLCCEGTANSASLIQLLGNKLEGKVLLLTDGFWSRDDTKNLKRWKDCLPLDTLRIIKIGTDANPQLKGTDVFSSEELFAALDGWQEGSTT
jgi:hypothetical protein